MDLTLWGLGEIFHGKIKQGAVTKHYVKTCLYTYAKFICNTFISLNGIYVLLAGTPLQV